MVRSWQGGRKHQANSRQSVPFHPIGATAKLELTQVFPFLAGKYFVFCLTPNFSSDSGSGNRSGLARRLHILTLEFGLRMQE